MTGILHLTWYQLKRTSKHKALILAVLILPLVGGLVRILLPGAQARVICAWACPIACAVLVFGWVWILGQIDRVSGLADGIESTRISGDALLASRVAAGAALLALQICIVLILSALGR